jgi:hypothetical protein
MACCLGGGCAWGVCVAYVSLRMRRYSGGELIVRLKGQEVVLGSAQLGSRLS